MMGGKRPTKAQQDWQDWQREQCCCNCGAPPPSAIHHMYGSTAKHNKIHVGQWATIPLCYDCHQGLHGIHGDVSRFEQPTRKEAEKDRFRITCINRELQGYSVPMSDEVINAIMDYRR